MRTGNQTKVDRISFQGLSHIHFPVLEMKRFICLLPLFIHAVHGSALETVKYGADVSFPIHHADLQDGPLGDRNAIYQDFMKGCREFYGAKGDRCDSSEEDRLEMSLRQSQSMVVSRKPVQGIRERRDKV